MRLVYLNRDEVRRMMQAAYERNQTHHQCLLVMFLSGLRVSEAIAIEGKDISDRQLFVSRLKNSKETLHTLRVSSDPLFDQSPLIEMAKINKGRLFDFSRQRVDQFIKRYAELAGLHPSKAHSHVLKHSICIALWEETHDLNAIQDHVGHAATSSTLVYVRKAAADRAQAAVLAMAI